jgi:uncharacterized protein
VTGLAPRDEPHNPRVNEEDDQLAALQALLESLPAPLEPLDVSALDGFLCGVLVQPRRVAEGDWLPPIIDAQSRPAPPGPALDDLCALLRRRHAQIDRAIERRDWFDPWVCQLEGDGGGDGDAPPTDAVLPWVAGFATAMERFPALMDLDEPALIEPLALVYLHFDPSDLEEADGLLEVIETIEPPADLAEAVQDLVRALMLIADVTRPRVLPRPAPAPRKPTRHAKTQRRPRR